MGLSRTPNACNTRRSSLSSSPSPDSCTAVATQCFLAVCPGGVSSRNISRFPRSSTSSPDHETPRPLVLRPSGSPEVCPDVRLRPASGVCGTGPGFLVGFLAKGLLDRNSTYDMIFRILVLSVPAVRRAVQIAWHLSQHDSSSDAICISIIRKTINI